jgi:neutral ceramidase
MKGWKKKSGLSVLLLVIVIFSVIAPIDYSPLHEQDFYRKMKSQMERMDFPPAVKGRLKAGWKKISITPAYPMPMAGYRKREAFESVHDSLYARVIVLNANRQSYYVVSVDLLLFPPALKEKLYTQLSKTKPNAFLYVSATHTHNSVGGWHDSIVGEFAVGEYHEKWINQTAEKIARTIDEVESNLLPVRISSWQSDASEYSENRLKSEAPSDGMLRGIRLQRSDSASAYLITFSAHPTSISKKSRALTGDYPAALVDSLHARTNAFGMFMAGMVGSHRLRGIPETEFEMVAKAGGTLAEKTIQATHSTLSDTVNIRAYRMEIPFGASQMRLLKNWKLRDWIFSWLVNPLQGELTILEINNVILIGTPCDFSGEIFVKHIAPIALQQNKQVIITSFNGGYVGYITEDDHYEKEDKEEVTTLNWVGPYFGTYFSEMINELIRR